MADRSNIEWTDATWNPIVGCSITSPGCTNCYAMSMARRIEAMQPGSHYAGTTRVDGRPVWTGKVALAPDHILTQPLRWRRPRRICVNSMGDLFHEAVPDEWIDRVFAAMALCPQHTFQVLTKRSARMRAYLTTPDRSGQIFKVSWPLGDGSPLSPQEYANRSHFGRAGRKESVFNRWPLPNVWLGVSTEDQRRADERVPDLLATPAAVRFVSAEPLLGPVDFGQLQEGLPVNAWLTWLDGLDWVIVGGESGPKARPMHPDWVRFLRDQCAGAGTAFFLKQWGEWLHESQCKDGQHPSARFFDADGRPLDEKPPFGPTTGRLWHWWEPEHSASIRIKKKAAGRLLDGVEYNALPEAR